MFFNDLESISGDPIFTVKRAFLQDKREKKVDLSIGVFPTFHLKKRRTLKCIEEAFKRLQGKASFDYLFIDGDLAFVDEIAKLTFGESSFLKYKSKIYGVQSVGGTGGLSILADFLYGTLKSDIYIPEPTWPNHFQIFSQAGFNIITYPYYDPKGKISFEKMIETLKRAPTNSVVLFHGCCHNPSGLDLTLNNFKELSSIIANRHLFPLFDLAYLGLGDGLEVDRKAIELFLKEGHDFGVVTSCSKNFGLYGERLGTLYIVSSEKKIPIIATHLRSIIRGNYSNPPTLGAQLVREVLLDENLTRIWSEELSWMRNYLFEMKSLLTNKAREKGCDLNLEDRKGLFALLPLSEEQVLELREKFAIYLLLNGRINIAGLTLENVNYVMDALLSVL